MINKSRLNFTEPQLTLRLTLQIMEQKRSQSLLTIATSAHISHMFKTYLNKDNSTVSLEVARVCEGRHFYNTTTKTTTASPLTGNFFSYSTSKKKR